MLNRPFLYFYLDNTVNIVTRYCVQVPFNTATIEEEEYFYDTTLNDFDLFSECIDNTFPHFIYQDATSIPQLSNWILDKYTVDKFNVEGLSIYLTEALLQYVGSELNIYKENGILIHASNSVPVDVDNTNVSLDFNLNNQDYHVLQLDSINQFVVRNSLTNVIVYSCEYDAYNIFLKKYPNLKICYNDIFLQSEVKRFIIPDVKFNKFNYKFLISNWKYQLYRYIATLYSLSTTSIKASWPYKIDFDKAKDNLWFDIKKWKIQHPDIYKKISEASYVANSDISIDYAGGKYKLSDSLLKLHALPNADYHPTMMPSHFYDDTFCTLVCECAFAVPTSSISEKTLITVLNKRPFILIGQPKSLDLFKKLGFKTFDKWWSEDYDLVLNHEDRFIEIFKTIDYIDSLDMKTIQDIYADMLPKLEYNYNLLLDYINGRKEFKL